MDGMPEKVAWVLTREDRVLVTRNRGRDRFYFPGGMREPGESDGQTLVREIDEELRVAIDAATMVYFMTFHARGDAGGPAELRMICYEADLRGALIPAGEIAEIAWFGYAERDRVSAVDQLVFDRLHDIGRLT